MGVVREAIFENAFFVSVLFKGVHQFQDCRFTNTDFSQCVWESAGSPHRILNCKFLGSHFDGATFEYLAFYNCQFDETSFANAQFKLVKFVNCQFNNCIIDDVDFSNTVMSLDMLEKMDFTSCQHPPKNWTGPYQKPDEEPVETVQIPEGSPDQADPTTEGD